MKISPEIAAATGISFIAIVAASYLLALILIFSGKNVSTPDVKALVTEAAAVDFAESGVKSLRIMWRRTIDPNEIVVVGVVDALSGEHFFITKVVKYDSGWVVGRFEQDNYHMYQVMTRKDKKKELTKK